MLENTLKGACRKGGKCWNPQNTVSSDLNTVQQSIILTIMTDTDSPQQRNYERNTLLTYQNLQIICTVL